jgi:hypothetical protein
MSSPRRTKGKGKRKERSYDLERDEQDDGDVTPEQDQDGDVTPENGGNDILRDYLRKRRATGGPSTQQNQEGTPNSIVTNNRLTQSEFELIQAFKKNLLYYFYFKIFLLPLHQVIILFIFLIFY